MFTFDQVVEALCNMSVMQIIQVTKELETKWGVQAAPRFIAQAPLVETKVKESQSEFDVILTSVSAEKKMSVIKMVRDICALGLKESKDLVESVPKVVKFGVSKDEAELVLSKLIEAGAVAEMK